LTRRRLAAACTALALLVVGLFGAGLAAAQGDGPPTLIRAIDASDPENVQLQLLFGGDNVGDAQIVSDGTELETGEPAEYLATDSDAIGLVIVVDTGTSMDDTGGLTAARDGISELIAQKPDGQLVAIIAAGDSPTLVHDFSANKERLESSLEALAPSPEGGVALWQSVGRAGELLQERSDLQPNILVITSGTDTVGGEGGAVGQSVSAGATVFVAGAANAGFEPGSVEALVEEAGGSIQSYADGPALVAGIPATQGWLAGDQYVIPFQANRDSGVVPITVTIGDEQVEGAYVPGRFTQGAQGVKPVDTGDDGFKIPLLSGTMGKYIGVALAVVAVAAFVYAMFLLVTKDEGALSNVLQPYSEGYGTDGLGGDDDEESSGLATSALLQRAVAVTEQVAESQGYLSRTEAALERASLPLRAGEALFFYVVGVVVFTILAFVVLGNLVGGLVVGGIVALIPPAAVTFLAGRRRRAFLQQLPDMLTLLAGTLRAGYSLMQGVEAVSQEVAEPMGKELRRVVTESRLGRPLEEALDGVAERMSSPDFAWAVMAIRIQREVGGNLSELLMTVAETMTQRERLRRDIQALTAEGRISAYVLAILPIGLGVVMFFINPEYIGQLFDTTLGNILLGLAILGMAVGFLWMNRIIKIEI
jgi:tight adherence protein B